MKEEKKSTLTRRQFLKLCGVAGTGLYLSYGLGLDKVLAYIPGGTLDPTVVPKYVAPLVIPPAMPRTRKIGKGNAKVDYYEIAVRQFQQQILPAGMPATTVWSYGSANHPGTFNYPAFTIEAKVDRPVQVKWINDLKDVNGNYLPHLLPVDPTLHWANPPGGTAGRDSRPDHTGLATPSPYTGPVPLVTHVHGAHTNQESDGYPEAWFLPAANNIPAGYATEGTWYNSFAAMASQGYGATWGPGFAVFQYPNDQRATTLWYHDHALGMTRLNVYAGPAGFYLLRGKATDAEDGVLPGPAPAIGDPAGLKYYEIPIAIQDRSFNTDGSLFYPDTRAFFDEYAGPYIPDSDISPIWNPEFFGNAMVVNGNTWPALNVEARRYRFRFLNGCQSRFIVLKMVTGNPEARPVAAALPFWQIGAEGGFLPAPVQLDSLLMSPAERADVIVEFTHVPIGTEIYLINEGPDEPFGGGVPGVDFPYADPASTGQVMKFVVGPAMSVDTSVPPAELVLPATVPLGAAAVTRSLSLNEIAHEGDGFDGPVEAVLGTVENGKPVPKMWMDELTENPELGATEIWELYNFSEDAHPIHLHQVMFEVVDREPFTIDPDTEQVVLSGDVRPPETWESGTKDTVIAYPGEVTRIKARFDLPGLYVWHCHIVEHEDNEMMRPYYIGTLPPGGLMP